MKTATLALVAAVPAALAQCPADRCSDAVNALLNGGEALADYASDLCSSAIATTTTVKASQSTPSFGGYLNSIVRKDKRSLIDTVPSWASGCKNQAEFASACQCADVVPGTSTVTQSPTIPLVTSSVTASLITGGDSTGTAGGIPPYEAPSSVPYPASNTSTYPSGFSTGVPLSSGLPSGIQYIPQSSITASPTGPTTLEGPISSSSAAPSYTSSNITIPSGFSTGVPLSSSQAASIAFMPAAAITAGPTGPTTLEGPVSSTSSSSVSIPSGFSSGVPLSSASASDIEFIPAANVTASPTGPTTLSPVETQTATTSSLLPGASATKEKRDGATPNGDGWGYTPCPPPQVHIFFDLLTNHASEPCGSQ